MWFVVCSLCCVVCGLWFVVSGLWSVVCTLWFVVCGLQFLVPDLRSVLCVLAWFMVLRIRVPTGRASGQISGVHGSSSPQTRQQVNCRPNESIVSLGRGSKKTLWYEPFEPAGRESAQTAGGHFQGTGCELYARRGGITFRCTCFVVGFSVRCLLDEKVGVRERERDIKNERETE